MTATSLMESGDHTVFPADSIEHLQSLMTETGWGQIPVIDPQTNKIIGIVTRTDLLKTFNGQSILKERNNLASRLEEVLPESILALLKIIAQEAHKQHIALYIVGGFVRDLLLEAPGLDFDLVVEGDAISLARALAKQNGGRVTSHARFGTAKWHLDQNKLGPVVQSEEVASSQSVLQSIDLVSARIEFYTYPTALPTVERGSIKLDLHRRDFTINTLALRLDGHHYGELHDYWGGLYDLQQKQVRVLHSLSFVDDPTRILRAVRFEQRFGFKIEPRTMELLKEAIQLLDRLSGDRIRNEFDHAFNEPNASKIFTRMSDLGLLKSIYSELFWDEWLNQKVQDISIKEYFIKWDAEKEERNSRVKVDLLYILWMIRLDQVYVKNVIRRLRLPTDLGISILAACDLWKDRNDLIIASPSEITFRLNDVPIIACFALYSATSNSDLRSLIISYVTKWKNFKPSIDGHYLQNLGITPGPIYKKILNSLRGAWLDGKITSDEEEREFLEILIKKNSV